MEKYDSLDSKMDESCDLLESILNWWIILI